MAAGETMLTNMRILYVEDDEIVRFLMEQKLRRVAGEVIVAANGRQGLELFEKHSPDLVVSDVQMPKMDGLAMARAIKAINPGTPIILTTAHNETDYLLQAIEIGIDGYVTKPIRYDLLLETLNRSARTLYYSWELQRKNLELQEYYEAAERENHMVAELMARVIRNDNLSDPALQAWTCPARTFSGDLVAAQRAGNGDLFVILADATGHGLAAAMNLLPLARTFYRMVERGLAVSAMLLEMNNIVRGQSTAERFVAVTVARVDSRNRIVEVWNGGNPPAVWIGPNGAQRHLFKSTNLALGIVETRMVDIHTEVMQWHDDAQLLLFSDGVVEAENAAGEQFGLDALLAGAAGQAREERFCSVVRQIEEHVAGRPVHDDLSLIVVDCPATLALHG